MIYFRDVNLQIFFRVSHISLSIYQKFKPDYPCLFCSLVELSCLSYFEVEPVKGRQEVHFLKMHEHLYIFYLTFFAGAMATLFFYACNYSFIRGNIDTCSDGKAFEKCLQGKGLKNSILPQKCHDFIRQY